MLFWKIRIERIKEVNIVKCFWDKWGEVWIKMIGGFGIYIVISDLLRIDLV